MEHLDSLGFESRIAKAHFQKAAHEGRLLPVFDQNCELNVEVAKRDGFIKEHIFVLRNIFGPRLKNKTNDEVLMFANDIIIRMLRMREIYEELDARIADKKERGIY